jgi:uncharacterized membrane protein YkoI
MKKQLQISTIIILSALSLSACFDKDNEVEIPVSEVPANIITIVQNTLPGIDLSETKKEVKDGTVIYELEGVLINGKEYEIKISEDGTIIKIELED